MLTPIQTVEFNFYPQNHSVIRAEYEHPCIPYEMTGPGKVGFWSGFHAVDAVLNDVTPPSPSLPPSLSPRSPQILTPIQPPKWSLLVNDTSPTFFYCSAPDSCTKQAMVGVINPNATTSLAHQRSLALKASYQLSPGEPFPSEAETPSSSTLPDGSSVSPSAQPGNPQKDQSKLSAGAIAGITIACIGVVVLGSALAWFWGRFAGLRDEMRRKKSTVARSTEPRASWFGPGAQNYTSSSSDPWGPSSPIPAQTTPSVTMVSPAYTASPMTTHAVPPSYFEAQFGAPHAAPVGTSPRSGGGGDDDVARSGSRASRLGAPRTSDMTSPVDPGVVGGRMMMMGGLSDLQRLGR